MAFVLLNVTLVVPVKAEPLITTRLPDLPLRRLKREIVGLTAKD